MVYFFGNIGNNGNIDLKWQLKWQWFVAVNLVKFALAPQQGQRHAAGGLLPDSRHFCRSPGVRIEQRASVIVGLSDSPGQEGSGIETSVVEHPVEDGLDDADRDRVPLAPDLDGRAFVERKELAWVPGDGVVDVIQCAAVGADGLGLGDVDRHVVDGEVVPVAEDQVGDGLVGCQDGAHAGGLFLGSVPVHQLAVVAHADALDAFQDACGLDMPDKLASRLRSL